jgi:hypothetical protein
MSGPIVNLVGCKENSMQSTKSRLAAIAAALLLGISVPVFAQEGSAPQSTEEKAETSAKPAPAESSQKPDAAAKPEAKTDSTEAKEGEAAGADATTAADAANMVRVNVAAVRDSLATQLQVAAPTIPEFILASPDVAGEVCSVAPNSLQANLESGTEARCTAITTSQALRVAVQKQMAG